jgi:CRP-like cAMP-binding protein
MSEERAADVALMRRFTPLDGMKKENQAALASKVMVRTIAPGRNIFREGDTDRRKVWIVSGTVELRQGDRIIGVVTGGTAESRNPIGQHIPRRITAQAAEDVEFLSIDSELLDVMITWDQTGIYEVSDMQAQFDGGTGGEDWMTTLMQNKALHRIPPANIQAIFMRMQRTSFRAGEVVIRQGTEGDYFYAIVSGRCLVTRETPLNKDGIKLAELGVGESFGEEALISESKRNATVSMLTDGVLMRLGKQDFRELMNEPLLQWVTYDDARRRVAAGARWLDVRLPSEHQNLAIEGSMNIPLYFMRMKIGTLDRKTPYIVCCDTGRRSSAAAFILLERGYNAFVLKDGLSSAESGLRRAAAP